MLKSLESCGERPYIVSMKGNNDIIYSHIKTQDMTMTSFFLSQDDCKDLYQRSFFALMSKFAHLKSIGYDSREAWSMAYKWAVDDVCLDSAEEMMLIDLIKSACVNQIFTCEYLNYGKKVATLEWSHLNQYPELVNLST